MITIILFWALLGGLVMLALGHRYDDSGLGWALTISSIILWPHVLMEKMYEGAGRKR